MATKVVMISYKNFIYVISTLSSIILSKINDLAQRVHVSEILHHFPNLPHPHKVGGRTTYDRRWTDNGGFPSY